MGSSRGLPLAYLPPASPEVMPSGGSGGFARMGIEDGLGKDGDCREGGGEAGEEGGAGGAGNVLVAVDGAF